MRTRLILLGLASLVLYVAMWRLSYQFNWGEGYRDRPILTYLAIYFGLFGLYAIAVLQVLNTEFQRKTFFIIVAFGLLFRAVLLPAQQIQEDDVYRYLWDGKVFAHGVNPFKYAPEEVTGYKEFLIKEPARFRRTYNETEAAELARLDALRWQNDTSLVYMERINHPHVPTIYPPLAQYVFRLAHNVKPDSIVTLRLLFGLFDLAALAFIVSLLRTLGKNPNACLVYFWSPLVIKETYNSTHLDIIGIAMLCGALAALVRARFFLAHLYLALGVLAKLYPVILFPLILQQQWRASGSRIASPWARCGLGGLLFSGVITAGYLPFLDIGTKAFQGLQTYGTYWQSNDSIFALLTEFFRLLPGVEARGPVALSYDLPSLLAKFTVMLILAGTLLYYLRRPAPMPGEHKHEDQIRPLFVLMALVFLLSPVQNPWYLCWVVPFLCVFPWRAWILLTGLVGLYYLDFYFEYQDLKTYSPWIPWFEYLPFYLALGWEWWRNRVSKPVFSEL